MFPLSAAKAFAFTPTPEQCPYLWIGFIENIPNREVYKDLAPSAQTWVD